MTEVAAGGEMQRAGTVAQFFVQILLVIEQMNSVSFYVVCSFSPLSCLARDLENHVHY